MKRIITLLVLALVIGTAQAQLPSWGMTENQYQSAELNSKLNDIGKEAVKRNWLLKVTAPQAWHRTIMSGLTNTGERDVQLTFKDSVHKGITIAAAKGAKIAKISKSSASSAPVQKQVVIDKPEMDTQIDAPEFEAVDIQADTKALLEDVGQIEITVPQMVTTTGSAEVKVAKEVEAAKAEVKEQAALAVAPVTPLGNVSDADKEKTKENLRKRHARTKRVERTIGYAQITPKDDLFVEGDVVLVKRFVNQGVVLYFWMAEDYDPVQHLLLEKGSGKYKKNEVVEKVAGQQKEKTEKAAANAMIELGFVAIDTSEKDKNELRGDYARNKRVTISINANQLKAKDVLYVRNQTVLVQRPISSAQSSYFWLVGETVIPREVKQTGKNRFRIK